MKKDYSEKIVELRKALGLTQQGLATLIGLTGPAIANYESGTREPDPLVCTKLALVSSSADLRAYFCQLADDPGLAVIVARIVMGDTGVRQTNTYQTGVEWTRDDLERDPTFKWAWALRFRGRSKEEQEAGARSMGISLKTLHKWIEVAFVEGPEGFVSEKTKRAVFTAISPRTPEETRLVTRLLTVLRSPGAKTKGLKAVIDDAYESLAPR